MTTETRDKLREKQDLLLELAAIRGHGMALRISADNPGSPTLRDLTTFVFPDWEHEIDTAISFLQTGM